MPRSTDDTFDRLCALLPAQFESVLLRAKVPAEFVSPPAAPHATRATEVLRWMRQAPDHEARLSRALATVRSNHEAAPRWSMPPPADAPVPAASPGARLILFMAAEPTDASRLRVGKELEEIRDRLRVPIAQGQLMLDSRFALRPRDLSRVLHDTQPSIVHFSGHGSQDHRLVLEADDGSHTAVEPDALEALFSHFPGVQAIVLNACWSDEQAEALVHSVPHVVGMLDQITDKAAIAFSSGLYGALAAGRAFPEAFEFGCIELRLLRIPEHLTPALMTRDAARSKRRKPGVSRATPARHTDGNATPGAVDRLDALYQELRETDSVSDQARVQTLNEEIRRIKLEKRAGGQVGKGDVLGDDGRYKLVELIGKGGFATVWKAYDRQTRRFVAVKVLHAEHARDESRRERFFRGARQMATLNHPGILRVLETHGEDHGWHYFVMELIEGEDLDAAVRGGRVSAAQGLALVLEVAEALSYAHGRGLVHRDVAPPNILVDQAGHAHLGDFDLVRADDSVGGTRTSMLGRFLYAAPELMSRPHDVDRRTDVYALGMTLAFVYAGKPLDLDALTRQDAYLAVLPCPDGVRNVIARAIQHDVASRFESAAVFAQALRELSPTVSQQGEASLPQKTVEEHPAARLDEPHRLCMLIGTPGAGRTSLVVAWGQHSKSTDTTPTEHSIEHGEGFAAWSDAADAAATRSRRRLSHSNHPATLRLHAAQGSAERWTFYAPDAESVFAFASVPSLADNDGAARLPMAPPAQPWSACTLVLCIDGAHAQRELWRRDLPRLIDMWCTTEGVAKSSEDPARHLPFDRVLVALTKVDLFCAQARDAARLGQRLSHKLLANLDLEELAKRLDPVQQLRSLLGQDLLEALYDRLKPGASAAVTFISVSGFGAQDQRVSRKTPPWRTTHWQPVGVSQAFTYLTRGRPMLPVVLLDRIELHRELVTFAQ